MILAVMSKYDIWTKYKLIDKQGWLCKITTFTTCFNILFSVVFYSKYDKFDYFWFLNKTET